MPKVNSEIRIKRPGRTVYEIVSKMDAYPSFMKDVVSVEILETGDNYDLSHWVTNADGRRIEWTEKDVFDPENLVIAYSQVEGDLKKMEGQWEIRDAGQECQVSLSVDFEFGIPMIAGLLNPLLKRKVRENCENMLRSVKEQLEKE